MMANVKTVKSKLADLRARVARHMITREEIAQIMGVSASYVAKALRASIPVSQEQTDRIERAIKEVESARRI